MHRGNLPQPFVVALVPVYNEEVGVVDTIRSLFQQTVPPEIVCIIANNCRDRTAEVARELIEVYGDRLHVLEFPNLKGRKAGALNQGYHYIKIYLQLTPEFILQMDGDTVLNLNLIEQSVIEFDRDEFIRRKSRRPDSKRLGGLCSRCIPLPLEACLPREPKTGDRKSPSLENKILWRFQNLEYGQADPFRLKDIDGVKVLAGAVSIYRFEALEQVLANNQIDGINEIWSETSLVEDYKLTIAIKELGWKAKVGWGMKSETDIPITFKAFFAQRKRWYGGTAMEVRQMGAFKKHARGEVSALIQSVLVWALLILMTALITKVYISGGSVDWTTPWLWFLPLTWLILQLQLFFVRRKDLWQILITATLLPYQVFDLYRQYILFYAWYQCFRGKLQSW